MLALLGGLLTVPAFAQANPGDSIYNGLQIHTINLVFPQSWTTVDAQLKSNKEAEINIPGRIEINCIPSGNPRCITFDSVGVRYKGNSTFSSNSQKNPFRIDFDAYGIDQRWDGMKGFILNNSNSDASYMREKIHTDFAIRVGLVSPRFSYAQVYVNGAIHSFYQMGELVDGPFLKTRLGENDGDLFKAVDGLGANQFSDFQRKSPFTTSAYQSFYENKSDSTARAWARLITLIDTLNLSTAQRLPDAMAQRVNLDGLYRGLGSDILFANFDAYIQSGRNFQFYFPEADNGKMEWILWDMSLSFGAYGVGGGGGGGGTGGTTPGASCTGTTAASIVCGGSTRPMVNKIMTTPAMREDYLRALWFMYNAHFADGWLSSRIDSVQTLIASAVTADTKSRTSNIATAFAPGVTTLKTFVTNRITSVNSQFTTQGITAANAIRNGDIILTEIAPSQGWVEVYNNRSYSIDLSGHALTNDPLQPTKWTFPLRSFVAPGGFLTVRLQGGSIGAAGPANFGFTASNGGHLRLNRANGTVVDSVTFGSRSGDSTVARLGGPSSTTFGVGFPTPGAVNIASSAGTTNIAPRVVTINEFMADNDTIVSPAGIKADWIELYNTTSSPVSLAGLGLSDNPNNPGKWTFPVGTTIAANGYLVVWAYDTTVTGTLFADWSLSKDGEHIRLTNADSSVIDSVTFGAQTKSRTMARIPNGTGAFSVSCGPTIGSANNCTPVGILANRPVEYGLFALSNASGHLTARFTLATSDRVRLSVHDARGREVAVILNESMAPGSHVKPLDASALPAGLYWFRLRAGADVYTRTGVITK
jgi:hypothetical protein